MIIDKPSPKCPQPIFPVRMEDALIQIPTGLASHAEDVFDEFECLNLNITTPAGSNETSQLPVLIYIHGGGGFSGANSDWWCDGSSIVAESIKFGKPIVMVAIK
jgi:carboxylesterase type B